MNLRSVSLYVFVYAPVDATETHYTLDCENNDASASECGQMNSITLDYCGGSDSWSNSFSWKSWGSSEFGWIKFNVFLWFNYINPVRSAFTFVSNIAWVIKHTIIFHVGNTFIIASSLNQKMFYFSF
jgi:hypothetical protein